MSDGVNDSRKQSVACLSVFSNLFLTVTKILAGISIGSVSIISEGIHSGMDLLASCISYISVKKSAKPPDTDHAFGHGKYEDASGLFEALLIVLAAGIIIWEACHKSVSGEGVGSFDTLLYTGMVVMGISAVINFFVSQLLMKVSKETGSIALESDAWHLRTDVLTSIGVFVGLLTMLITHFVFLDSAIAIIVALLILREAYSLIRRSFADLMDESLEENEVYLINEIICRHSSEFTNFHSLKTRRSGPDRFVEFHLMMPHTMPLDTAHVILKRIESDLIKEIPRISVIIHLDPCDGRCGLPVCSFVCKVQER